MQARPRLGVVLGSGSARGWAHLGVLAELGAMGVQPDLVCGCSIGALVGAAYAMDDLPKLESWARSLTRKQVFGLLDLSFKSGLIRGERLMQFFAGHFVDCDFSELKREFAIVATDLATGREIWLREGSVLSAVRASIALPGLMRPLPHGKSFLVDGGLVNPVPVSLARAMGAETVIAVDLGSDVVGRRRGVGAELSANTSANGSNKGGLGSWLKALRGNNDEDTAEAAELSFPSLVNVLTTSINIMQVRIARSRLAGDPADVMINPRLGHLGLLDYHRAEEAIAEGRAAVRRMHAAIEQALAA
ncbi:MAG: patatin-like phospholipase RssA [Rhodocyclaceae bacterium]|nr:patatin-like phospholipase RssA [Rhodocyclaceae bacterium]